MTDGDRAQIARRFVEQVWGDSDRDVANEIVAADVVHHRRRRGERLGRSGLFQGLDMYDAAFGNRRFTQDDVVVDGKLVADRWTMTAVHDGDLFGIPPTARTITLTGMNRYLIDGGKIVEVWHDEDIQGMVDQVGGLPVPPSERAPWPPASARVYGLPGPQVEPDGSFWTIDPAPLPTVPRMSELIKRTDDPDHPWYFPPYPDDQQTRDEIQELKVLASLRDDPEALAAPEAAQPRLGICPFLQLRPQPLGAVYDLERAADEPVIATGRELARYFEGETPGLGHRHALNYLLAGMPWSPTRQGRIWMALDTAVYGGLLAAWHYKWFSGRDRVGYRPRPVEVDYRVSVLFNAPPNATGSGDGRPRQAPQPSPGTPRHPAYPSGHSTVAGAASEMLSYFFPDQSGLFDQLADNCGMARLWAGIHYRSDHERGIRLGRSVARAIIEQLEAGCVGPPQAGSSTDRPPTRDQVIERSEALRRCAQQATAPR